MASAFAHEPVLLDESVRHLQLQSGSVVVDGTVGGGGHARRILQEIGERGRLIGLDLDPQALAAAARRLERSGAADPRVRLVHASFRNLDQVVRELDLESVDAVLLDLGVSSHQLDAPGRGFRFGESGVADVPLDMRMNPDAGPSAAELLRRASAEELERWFREYGELPGARRLARAIAERRRESPLTSSADLLRLIGEARVGRGRRHHPATLVFQALRIAVNDELSALREGLEAAVSVLRPGGRLVVIAYHSLEDRIVKHTFRAAEKGCICPPGAPVCTCGHTVTLRVITKRPLRPDAAEIERNPRARSARLRAAERVGRRAA